MIVKHVAIVVTAIGIAGCHLEERPLVSPQIRNGKLYMGFRSHSISARCFDTVSCRVTYGDMFILDEDRPEGPLTQSDRDRFYGNWGQLDPPSTATIAWTSKDGSQHEEKIRLGEIFSSGLVHYASDLNLNEVNLAIKPTAPSIILVVEDRSVSVYMRAHITLIRSANPYNRMANFREDLVTVYKRYF